MKIYRRLRLWVAIRRLKKLQSEREQLRRLLFD